MPHAAPATPPRGGACVSTESGIQYRVQSEVEPGLLAVRQAGGISALFGLAAATANTITIPGITAPPSTPAGPPGGKGNSRPGNPRGRPPTRPLPPPCPPGAPPAPRAP